jgi:hypothetical protein
MHKGPPVSSRVAALGMLGAAVVLPFCEGAGEPAERAWAALACFVLGLIWGLV